MKVKMRPNCFYILGYQLKLIIKIWQLGFYFSSEPGEFGPIFFFEKSFCIVGRWKSDFSGQNLAKFRQKRKKEKRKNTGAATTLQLYN
jgi:hypothetical protein